MMQGNRIKDVLKVLSSNGMLMLSGFVISFLLPIKLPVEDFGYWQFYFFYSGFVGLFMFGFSDGIHLKYAGYNYESLDKKLFRTYFRVVLFLSILMCGVFILFVSVIIDNPDRMFTLLFISLNIIVFNVNGFFTHINQITSRFKYYSWGLTLDRIVFVLTIIPMFFLPFESYKHYIIVNIVSRLVVLFYNLLTSKDIIFGQSLDFKECLKHLADNFKVGIFLTLSAILSMFLVSFTRIIVDKYMGISAFGLYSFANSILSMAIQVVIAISTVLYPILRKTDKEKYGTFIQLSNQSILVLGSVMLCSYFPVGFLIQNYLPKYSPILEYLFCLFPLMIYQCKDQMVILTFYKALRLEKIMLINSAIGLTLNFAITMLAFKVFGNILSIAASSVMCYAIWCYYTEWYLIKKSNWSYSIGLGTADLLIILGFIISTQQSNLVIGCALYILILLVIGIIYRKYLTKWFSAVLTIIRV